MKRKLYVLFMMIVMVSISVACSAESTMLDGRSSETAAALEDSAGTGEIVAVASVDDTASIATDATATTAEETVARPEGWSEESHSNDVAPNYDVVFPEAEVNQITITIDPAQWEAMQADMTALLGEAGQGGMGAGEGLRPGGGGTPPTDREPPSGDFTPPEGLEPPTGEFDPGQGGGMRDADMVDGTPIWVPATVEFEGNTWTNVGIRYKGNSSLTSAWNSGSLKMPLKLDFDEFEDDYPEIDNQRFYGFKQLSLANGFSDSTYMRETVTYDLMEEAGLVAGETAFYEVVLDYGEGPVSLGIYTMVEVIDDTVVESAFGDDGGNIYEGDGSGVSLAEGTYDQIADSFEKENNEEEADWSDIETLYTVLHSETRTTDPEQWRADLEAIFDVDTFLNWLAVSAVVQNWDTYGSMTHNFYLYNNPDTGQLVWLPWDHNMTLGSGGGGGREETGGRGGMGGRGNVSFDKAEVGDNWPLIRYLLDDATYYEKYLGYLAEANELFNADELNAQIAQTAEMLRPFIIAAGEESQFDSAVEQLKAVVSERDTAVAEFLAAQ